MNYDIVPKELFDKVLQTNTSKKLCDLLMPIWDDAEFIFGTLLELKTDEQKQKLINEIERGINDSDKVIEISLSIVKGEF